MKKNLNLTMLAAILKGGENGPAVVPKDLKKSLLWEQIDLKNMPPEGQPQLTAAEIATIKKWIETGARDNKAAMLAKGD